MRFTSLLACSLLAACSSSQRIVLSSAQESPLPSIPSINQGFEPVAAGQLGYVSFGLLLNEERSDFGVATVTENAVLNGVAQAHAEDQVANDYLDHTSQDGLTAGDRALAGGYDYQFIAENIAQGFDGEAEVVDAWMGSPGHVDNMLDVRAEEFGLGREDDTWVLLLGAEFPSNS